MSIKEKITDTAWSVADKIVDTGFNVAEKVNDLKLDAFNKVIDTVEHRREKKDYKQEKKERELEEEKRERERILKETRYVKTEDELEKALDDDAERIVLSGDLYYELSDTIKDGKKEKKYGKIGIVGGLFGPSNPIGWITLAAGGISYISGRIKDKQYKEYKIEIVKERREIVLTKKK